MSVAGLLVFLLVRAGYPARLPRGGGSQRFTLLAAFTAIATFAMLIFGANVTAADAALVFPDWPLMGGAIVPPFGEMPAAAASTGPDPGAPPVRRRGGGHRPGRDLDRGVAGLAGGPGEPDALPARHRGRRALPAPGAGGRVPGLDAAGPVDRDPPRRVRDVHLGSRDRGGVRELLRCPVGGNCRRTIGRPGAERNTGRRPRRGQRRRRWGRHGQRHSRRRAGRPALLRTRSGPMWRSRSPGSSSSC